MQFASNRQSVTS